jgi:hypothetical protein
VLLEQHTASSSATLDFTCISAAFDEYMIEITGLMPATNWAIPELVVSSDGGSTWLNDSYYWNLAGCQFGGAGVPAYHGDNVAFMALWSDGTYGVGTTGSPALEMSIRMRDPLNASYATWLSGQGHARAHDDNNYAFTWGGVYYSVAAINAFRVIMSSGNIASGTIRVYGLAKS